MRSPAARQDAQRPEPVHQADQGGTAAQARRRYLQAGGDGLVVACLGSVARPAEIRTRDGNPFLAFSVVADGFRSADELPATVRIEFHGDVDALAAKLTKNAEIYAEGSLRLNTWIGRDGVERTGLNIKGPWTDASGEKRAGLSLAPGAVTVMGVGRAKA